MTLLGFTVRNHKSIRDEITIDLTRPSLRTLRPQDGDWGAETYPIAGIFGGNATGKSAILDALMYTVEAIAWSATTWQAFQSMRRFPFALDGSERTASSSYELDFVYEGRRHLYGFEVDHDGIRREWLRDVPKSRWRTLLERDRDAGTLKFHQSVRPRFSVTDRELVLSRARLLRDATFQPVAQWLVDNFDCVLVKGFHRDDRLSGIAKSLMENAVKGADLEALLQVADIGVTKIDVVEKECSLGMSRAIQQLRRAVREEFRDEFDTDDADLGQDLENDEFSQASRYLVFTHRGNGENSPEFSIEDESDGTIAWLATAVPALEALRGGTLLLVDEIDSSLHPHLLEVLLGAFADPTVNTRNAQLVFTSHESYVLSPLSEVALDPEQIWFTDKSYDGATEVACLADFPKHPDANVARRYLLGRYGGVPRLAPNTFAALVGNVRNRG